AFLFFPRSPPLLSVRHLLTPHAFPGAPHPLATGHPCTSSNHGLFFPRVPVDAPARLAPPGGCFRLSLPSASRLLATASRPRGSTPSTRASTPSSLFSGGGLATGHNASGWHRQGPIHMCSSHHGQHCHTCPSLRNDGKSIFCDFL